MPAYASVIVPVVSERRGVFVCVFVQEMYSKGMILTGAIGQVRGLGDNKFEVVTSLRTFVFRAEGEGTSAFLPDDLLLKWTLL